MKTTVRVRDLNVRYNGTPVLKEISFAVSEREFFIVIGPNGSGKTTLIKALAGSLKPAAGTIEVLQRPLSSYSRKELARHTAVVPQNMPTDLPFTVAEVVLMGRSPHLGLVGWEKEKDRLAAEQAMAFAHVDHLAGRRLDELSGGEQQRVFIARALCQEPRLLLLDEPTASLDLAHQIHVMDLLDKMRHERSITVVMVSHDLNLSAMYGDRVLLIDHGREVRLGSPAAVFTDRQLEKTFRCRLLVDRSPLGDVPRVTLVPARFATRIEPARPEDPGPTPRAAEHEQQTAMNTERRKS